MAHPDYKAMDIDSILNTETANTAEMARFDRIMQHRTADATLQLAKQMQGVSATIYKASELADERASKVIPKLDLAISKADEAIAKAEQAGIAQGRQQKAMTRLTIALVVCTAMYTIINGWVAFEMRDANRIQSLVAIAAGQQASAAQDANSIQRQALHISGQRAPQK